MKKMLTFLLLASVSANAQTPMLANPNQTMFVGLMNSSSAKTQLTFAGLPGNIPIDTASMNSLKIVAENYNKGQQFKSVFSDYVVLPNTAKGKFEILDHEGTKIDGATVDLSKYILSNAYTDKIPADANNGAIKFQHAIYEEATTGAGSLPYIKTIAPEPGSGTSVQIYTYANLMVTNVNGAFQINNPNGNSLQLATTSEGGQVGWKTIDSASRLFLGANYVSLPGQLDVKGSINTATSLWVGDPKSSGVNVTANSISFLSNYSDFPRSTDNAGKDALVLTANGLDGIVLNSIGTIGGNGGMIRFESSSKVMASFSVNGIVIGNGLPGSSGLLTLISNDKGFILPKMNNLQIFSMDNPEEGTEVYSITEHAPVYFNGSNWVHPSHFKMLERPTSIANTKDL